MFKKSIALFLIMLMFVASSISAFAATAPAVTPTVLTPAQAAAAAAKAPIPKTVDYVLTKEDYVTGEGYAAARDKAAERMAAARKAVQSMTTFQLDHKINFKVNLKSSNTLVFSNIPESYDRMTVDIRDIKEGTVSSFGSFKRTFTYTKNAAKTFTIDLSALPNGTYSGEYTYVAGEDTDTRSFFFKLIVKDKKATMKFLNTVHEENYIAYSAARSDIYAIESYKTRLWVDDVYVKKANEITKGITNDYAKVKAIFLWVTENISYAYDGEGRTNPETGIASAGFCETYAFVTRSLMYAAGFPVKIASGAGDNGSKSSVGHAWIEVYVDNRWVIMDPTWGYVNFPGDVDEFGLPNRIEWFDESPYTFSNHRTDSNPEYMGTGLWDGRIEIINKTSSETIKITVDPVPYGSLLTSTFGYDPNKLYNKKGVWNFATDRITITNHYVWVDIPVPILYSVIFEPNGGGYKGTTRPVEYFINSVDNLKEGAKIPTPPTLTKAGYTFGGWYSDKAFTRPFNFSKDVVSAKIATPSNPNTAIIRLYAKWNKKK